MSDEEQPLLRSQVWSPYHDDQDELEQHEQDVVDSVVRSTRYLQEHDTPKGTKKKREDPRIVGNDPNKNIKRSKKSIKKIKHYRKAARKTSMISLKSTVRWTKGFFHLNSTTLPEPGLYSRHCSYGHDNGDDNNANYDDEEAGYLYIPYEIQYSIFKPVEHKKRRKTSTMALNDSTLLAPANGNTTKAQSTNSSISSLNDNGEFLEREKKRYTEIIQESIYTIQNFHIQPSRIQQGSSGSYFVYGRNASNRCLDILHSDRHSIASGSDDSSDDNSYPEFQVLGVFKPKDEEPYGPLSPKWTKWLHRTFFPYFFGRSCLIPNLGYICESAASLLDKRLCLNMIPYTDTVVLDSSSFYPKKSRTISNFFKKYFLLKKHNIQVQRKVGSYQLFLEKYMNADDFFEMYPLPGMNDKYSSVSNPSIATMHSSMIWMSDNGSLLLKFRLQLEKLIILDYLMRNTDRGFDNWMIKLIRDPETDEPIDIKIAAIDNALTFPWKHPDEWRSFPYGWLYLPINILNIPFHKETRAHFLEILTNKNWWEQSFQEFTELFSRDSEFKMRLWQKQWAVMKGQAFNVVETLKLKKQGPLELVRRTRCVVVDEHMEIDIVDPDFFRNLTARAIGDRNEETGLRIHPEHRQQSKAQSSILPQPFTSPMKLSYQSSSMVDENWKNLLNGAIDEQTWANQKERIGDGLLESLDEEPSNLENENLEQSFLFLQQDPVSATSSPLDVNPVISTLRDPFCDNISTPLVSPHSTGDNGVTGRTKLQFPPQTNRYYDSNGIDDQDDDENFEEDDDPDITQYHDAVENTRDYESIASRKPSVLEKKTVVIERLKLVTSKPPVFTWW